MSDSELIIELEHNLARLMAENELLKKDAERWEWFRAHTTASRDDRGRQQFEFPELNDSRVNLMQGSIAEHLDVAVDRAALKGEQK